MSQTIRLPFVTIPITTNAAHRMHHMAIAKIRKTIVDSTITAVRRAKTQPMDGAEITLHFRPGTRRLFDADALDACRKPIVDGVVRAGILSDDNWTIVPRITTEIHEPTRGTPGAMWLTLEEVYK